jgi:5-methylcytosine-specific restriction endonuclease McrA
MSFDWDAIFDNYGLKMVTNTDKNHAAYVLNAGQRAAMEAAGRNPADRETFSAEVLFDPRLSSLSISFYESVRAGSGRAPEVRMGQGLIRWANVGDTVVIGNRGRDVLVAKANAAPIAAADIGRQLARRGDKRKLMARAKKAKGKPARKQRTINDFVRNPYVVAGALLRAEGKCETPGCVRELFKRDDGMPFLEVHHIITLAEGGDDSLENAAALCPACHRELHFGANRAKRRKILSAAVAEK